MSNPGQSSLQWEQIAQGRWVVLPDTLAVASQPANQTANASGTQGMSADEMQVIMANFLHGGPPPPLPPMGPPRPVWFSLHHHLQTTHRRPMWWPVRQFAHRRPIS